MAINTQKFLPSAKGGALAKISGKSTFVSVSKKTVDDIGLTIDPVVTRYRF